MYKVIIVDDEPKVSELIKNLIFWDDLNLELMGIAKDGISAYEMIKKFSPDIVITDIRMPGYNGIELIKKVKEFNTNIDFIIISGYQYFDYAHNAIKYGVKDYLLKPLNKTEINETLTKMIEKYNEKKNLINERIVLEKRNNEETKKLKENFISSIFNNDNKDELYLNIDEINAKYNFSFKKGYYQVIVVKPDINYVENSHEVLTLLTQKTVKIINTNLNELCDELLIYPSKDRVFCIINYQDSEIKKLRKSLIRIIDDLHSLRDLFKNIRASIGVGSIIDNISKIDLSIMEAENAILDRIIFGAGKIIESKNISSSLLLVDNIVTFDSRRRMINCVEIFDITEIETIILDIEKEIVSKENISGKYVKDIVDEILNIIIYALKNNANVRNLDKNLFENFEDKFNMCNKITDIFKLLNHYIKDIITTSINKKKSENIRPIREAQKYINENFESPINLEEVSDIVGFNPSYFSSLFKKETGVNFLEYLTNVRIKAAKGMLSDTNKNISDISYEVGYKDFKHFSKQFKKITGLSPSKYRKLYY